MNSVLKCSFSLINHQTLKTTCLGIVPVRNKYKRVKEIKVPEPGKGINYRRKILFPEKYTIEPLKVVKLGGRDPVTGRKVCEGIGGGWPEFYYWVDYHRSVPKGSPPLIERVLAIKKDPVNTANVALIGHGDQLRYILATENMKVGDFVKTSSEIPRIPVRGNEGDAYPLGALPSLTRVNSVEKYPGNGGQYAIHAGTFVIILRKVDDKVILQLPSKHEICVSQECMATVEARLLQELDKKRTMRVLEAMYIATNRDYVLNEDNGRLNNNKKTVKYGRLSNIEHDDTPIGSAQMARHLGNRPRSGLWHRKTGKHGRKIRPLPPLKDHTVPVQKVEPEVLPLTLNLDDHLDPLLRNDPM